MVAVLLSFKSDRQTVVYQHSTWQEVAINEVHIEDQFWLPRIRMVQQVTLPSLFDIAEKQGKIDNFRIIAKKKKGKNKTL